MDQDKAIRLLIRQLKDIQAQAEKNCTGESSQETVEAFSRYSVELKEYISKNIQSEPIINYLVELPEIEYQRNDIQFWQYIIMPMWWIAAYRDIKNREYAIEQIQATRGRYATLEIMVKGLEA